MSQEQEVQTYVMVEGMQMPNSLEPAQTDLQAAYKSNGSAIVIDMEAAKPIARDLIRQARAPLFAKNDADTMVAMQRNDGDALEACRMRGDVLRDAPDDPRIEAAQNPAQLLHAVEQVIAGL